MASIYGNRKPIEIASPEEIFHAVRILNDQLLHTYQLLLFQDPPLSSPTGFPLRVERAHNPYGVAAILKVSYVKHAETLGLWFTVHPNMTDDAILEKAKMLVDGVKMSKVDTRACCVYAKKVFCVCSASFECPLHGQTCIGSHD